MSKKIFQLAEDSYTTEYTAVCYPISTSVLAEDSQYGGKTEDVLITRIAIFYNLRNNKQQIQLTKIEGSWTPRQSGLGMDFQNATVQLSDGAGLWIPKKLTWYNVPRSYSYTTGWGFAENYVASDVSGLYGYMEADYRVTGMGSNWFHNYTGLRLSFVA